MNWFSPEQLEPLLTRLVQGAESLPRHHLTPRWLCWVFEHARMHVAIRPEGVYLALYVENRPDLPAAAVPEVLESSLECQLCDDPQGRKIRAVFVIPIASRAG